MDRRRPHRYLVPALLAVASVIWLAAAVSVWVNRQALNSENWKETSGKLLAKERIQTALGVYLVDQLFTNVDVAGSIEGVLPPRLKVAAGPAAAGLRELAGRQAPRLLASSQVRDLWVQANGTAHEELVNIVEGGGDTVSTANGDVTLDLRAIVDRLAARVGLEEQVAAVRAKATPEARAKGRAVAEQKLGVTLPPSTGKLVVMRSEELGTAQDVGDLIKGLALVLPILALALFALAVWLARGWRRRALRTTGWCFVGVGLLLLIVRRVLGDKVVDSLVTLPSNRPAAHDAWEVATTLLYSIAVALVVYGVVIVVSAWLAGPTRSATAVRRFLAPSLRDHAAASYGFVGAVLLLVVLWGPTPAFRQLAWIALFAALLAAGVTALRRQTAVEFAGVQSGDAFSGLRARRASSSSGPNGGHVDELERLAELHDRGALTDEEFEAEKSAVRDGS
ncbi:MAG TPA: SHOCT domain-containing protein [Thermoleophilaceae bacterium]|nr:SHOCT domain-containing protein [Thermoleophilaceae bacterium]